MKPHFQFTKIAVQCCISLNKNYLMRLGAWSKKGFMRPVYKSTVKLDPAVQAAAAAFDYGVLDSEGKSAHAFDGTRSFEGWARPDCPSTFGIGLIVGPSGSGKTLLLREFGQEEQPAWEPDKA